MVCKRNIEHYSCNYHIVHRVKKRREKEEVHGRSLAVSPAGEEPRIRSRTRKFTLQLGYLLTASPGVIQLMAALLIATIWIIIPDSLLTLRLPEVKLAKHVAQCT